MSGFSGNAGGRGARRRAAVLGTGLAAAAGLCVGCATYVSSLGSDHTVHLISRPITAPVELVWRVNTFSREALGRMKLSMFSFSRLEKKPVPPLDPGRRPMDAALMHAWLKKKVGPPSAGTARLLLGGAAFFPALEEAIEQAKERIQMQTYIFDNDDVAVAIADRLKRKSAEVEVRVLLDLLGCRRAWSVTASTAPVEGSPLADPCGIIPYLRAGSSVLVRRSRNTWLSSNHIKCIAIDGQVGFVGGMNIGREYRYEWRDLMVRLTGPIVARFDLQFEQEWIRAGFFSDLNRLLRRAPRAPVPAAPADGEARFYVIGTNPFEHDLYRFLLHALGEARDRIYIECPYLWNENILYALCAARHRGVDVRVTLPSASNIALGAAGSRKAMNTLLRHGVRVFLHPGMTHVKGLVVDGWAIFGSANLDDLSLHKNNEMNLCTQDAAFVKEFETAVLLEGQDRSHEILDPLPSEIWDVLLRRLTPLM